MKASVGSRVLILLHQHPVWQWPIVGMVGIFLGIYTLGLESFPAPWALLSLLAGLFLFVAIIVDNLHRLLLAIIILDIPFQLDIHLARGGAIVEMGDLFALQGFILSVTTVSLVILYTLWLAELLSKRQAETGSRGWNSVTLFLTAYLASTILSVGVARNVQLSIYELVLLFEMFLLYIYVVATVNTREEVLFIIKILLVSMVLESLVMIVVCIVVYIIKF